MEGSPKKGRSKIQDLELKVADGASEGNAAERPESPWFFENWIERATRKALLLLGAARRAGVGESSI